jgi:hypothetical protein
LAAVGTDERYLFCASPHRKRLLLGTRGVGRFCLHGTVKPLSILFYCLLYYGRGHLAGAPRRVLSTVVDFCEPGWHLLVRMGWRNPMCYLGSFWHDPTVVWLVVGFGILGPSCPGVAMLGRQRSCLRYTALVRLRCHG